MAENAKIYTILKKTLHFRLLSRRTPEMTVSQSAKMTHFGRKCLILPDEAYWACPESGVNTVLTKNTGFGKQAICLNIQEGGISGSKSGVSGVPGNCVRKGSRVCRKCVTIRRRSELDYWPRRSQTGQNRRNSRKCKIGTFVPILHFCQKWGLMARDPGPFLPDLTPKRKNSGPLFGLLAAKMARNVKLAEIADFLWHFHVFLTVLSKMPETRPNNNGQRTNFDRNTDFDLKKHVLTTFAENLEETPLKNTGLAEKISIFRKIALPGQRHLDQKTRKTLNF